MSERTFTVKGEQVQELIDLIIEADSVARLLELVRDSQGSIDEQAAAINFAERHGKAAIQFAESTNLFEA